MTTQALLNFNGTNGSQVFTDETVNQTWTVRNGSPVLSDLESAHGDTSLLLNGSSSIQSTLVNPLTGDFTIEMWINNDPVNTYDRDILTFPNINSVLSINSSLTFIQLYDGDVPGFIFQESIGFTSEDQWGHIVFIRKDGRVRVIINGIYKSNWVDWTKTINIIELGQDIDNGFDYFYGNIDSLRIIDECIYNTSLYISTEPTLLYSIYDAGFEDADNISVLNKKHIQSYLGDVDGDASGSVLFVCGEGAVVVEPEPDPTSTNVISGNVSKLGLPFELKVVAVTVELNPEVVGQTTSNPITGDYSMDIWPWAGDTLVYAAPDYGASFNPNAFLAEGQIIHPTIPNKNVYVAQTSGFLGGTEPTWPESGLITSNEVQFLTVPLYRPLINGFIRPTVTPI